MTTDDRHNAQTYREGFDLGVAVAKGRALGPGTLEYPSLPEAWLRGYREGKAFVARVGAEKIR